MKMLPFARFASSGIVSELLILFAIEANGTRFAKLGTLLLSPGVWIVRVVFSHGVHRTNHFRIEFFLNLIFIWTVLFLILTLLDKLIRKRERE
jgi:hypothetical protein